MHECGGFAVDSHRSRVRKRIDMTHDDLVQRAESYLLNTMNCGFVFTELQTYAGEIPDAIGWRSGDSILIECKVSRSDFLCGQKKMWRQNPEIGMGKYRFYMCPKGLVSTDELPPKWGLIEVDGRSARRVHGPKGNVWDSQFEWQHEHNRRHERIMMISALRRLHLRGVLDRIYEPLTTEAEHKAA